MPLGQEPDTPGIRQPERQSPLPFLARESPVVPADQPGAEDASARRSPSPRVSHIIRSHVYIENNIDFNQKLYIQMRQNGGWTNCLPTPFRYPRNNVSDLLTSDSTTFSLCHLAAATSAVATLSPWEGLIPSRRPLSVEKGNWLSCCCTTNSITGVNLCEVHRGI